MRTVRRVLGYCRVSGAEQGRTGTSLQGQREEIERYCRAHELPAPDLFVEVESAGAEKLDRRRELQRLMNEAHAGDVVMVTKQDRWSRDTLFYLKSIDELLGRGCSFLAIGDQFDPTTPQGRFQATIMAAVAEHERALIKSRTVGRRKQLRDQGCYVEGLTPIGFRRENRRLVVLEAEAEMVRHIFARCIGGASLSEIAAECRARWSHRSSWDKATVHDVLRNRHVLGEVRASDGRWIKAHEPIIDAGTFARADRALKERRVGGRRHAWGSRTDAWLLRGLLRCRACGRRIGAAYSPNADYYACGGRIRRKGCSAPYARVAVTDDVVGALVLRHLTGLRAELAAPAPAAAVVPDFAPARARLEARRDRVLDMAEAGAIDRPELLRRIGRIDAAVGKLDEEEASARRLANASLAPHRRALFADLRALRHAWKDAPVQVRRVIVAELVDGIDLDDGTPRIVWKPLAALVNQPGVDRCSSPRLIPVAKVADIPGASLTRRHRRSG